MSTLRTVSHLLDFVPGTAGRLRGRTSVEILRGFPVRVRFSGRKGRRTIEFVARFRAGSLRVPPDEAVFALMSDPATLGALGRGTLPRRARQALSVTGSLLRFRWHYARRAPAAHEIDRLVQALVALLERLAEPPGTECEQCGVGTGAALGVEIPLCPACRSAQQRRLARPRSRAVRVAFGPLPFAVRALGLAAVAAAGWAALRLGDPAVVLLAALPAGAVLAAASRRLFGGHARLAVPTAITIAVAAFLAGDLASFVLAASSEIGLPLNLDLVTAVAARFARLELAQPEPWRAPALLALGVSAGLLVTHKR